MPAVLPRSSARRRLLRPGTALATALLAGALSACSGSSDTSADTSADDASSAPPAQAESPGTTASPGTTESPGTAPSSSVLQLTEADFTIDLPQRELQAGSYTIEVTNEGRAVHDLIVEDAAGNDVAATEILSPGGSASVQVDLQPGEYVLYCSVDGHRGRGMELNLTVE